MITTRVRNTISIASNIALATILPFSYLLAEPPIKAKTTHFSDCDEKPCSNTESIRFFYDLDKISITHTNAWLECGSKGANLVIQSNKAGSYSIQEEEIREITTHPDGTTSTVIELCLCYYTIVYEISNPKTGNYIFKIKNPANGDPKSVVIHIDESKRSSGVINIRPVPVNLSRN